MFHLHFSAYREAFAVSFFFVNNILRGSVPPIARSTVKNEIENHLEGTLSLGRANCNGTSFQVPSCFCIPILLGTGWEFLT